MVEYKTIGIMTLILSGLIGGGVYTYENFNTDFGVNNYYCESSQTIKQCNDISCDGVVCESGWSLIVNDIQCTQYKCDNIGCVCV